MCAPRIPEAPYPLGKLQQGMIQLDTTHFVVFQEHGIGIVSHLLTGYESRFIQGYWIHYGLHEFEGLPCDYYVFVGGDGGHLYLLNDGRKFIHLPTNEHVPDVPVQIQDYPDRRNKRHRNLRNSGN